MSNKNNKLLTLKQLLYIIAGGILLTSWFSLTPSSYFFVAIPVGIFCLFLIIYEDEKEKEKSWAVFLLKNQIVLIVIILIIIGVSIIISLTSDDEYKTITFEVENNSERIEEEIGDAKEISNFIIEPISVPILDDAINQLEPVSEPEPESETKPEVQPENQIAVITKIIDGNTVVIESGDHVRLLGIDADESGYPCYYEAKNRLEELVLEKSVVLEKDQTDQDQYGRLLRYLVLNGLNINLRLIEDGLAICRFYDPDTRYKDSCVDLEKQAKNNEVGCKWAVSLPIPSASECTKLTPKKTGLELIQAEDAIDYFYEDKIVEGKVANTIEYSNSALFINFCKPYPNNCFTSIIWNSNWGKFPENAAEIYSNQTVRVEGRIELYRGKPQIVLDDSSQIEICE